MAFCRNLFSKSLPLFCLLLFLGSGTSSCVSGGAGGGGSTLGPVDHITGGGAAALPIDGESPPGGGNTSGGGGNPLVTAFLNGAMGPNSPTGVLVPSDDPVDAHKIGFILESIEECIIAEDNPDHTKVRFRLKGYVGKPKNKSSNPKGNDSPQDSKNTSSSTSIYLPPGVGGTQKEAPPDYSGRWVRFYDDIHHFYSEAEIGVEGDFKIILETKKSGKLHAILAPGGYPSNPDTVPVESGTCGFPLGTSGVQQNDTASEPTGNPSGSNASPGGKPSFSMMATSEILQFNSCSPKNYDALALLINQSCPFPSETSLPPCGVD